MVNKKLKQLAKDEYNISDARQFNHPFFNGIGDGVRDMVNNLKQGNAKGLVFFSGERVCYVTPPRNPPVSFSVRKEGLILAPSKDTYVPCIYTDGLIVYSPEDLRHDNHIRIEFPFWNTEIYVVESGRGVEIMLFEQKEQGKSNRGVNFGKAYDGNIDEQFREAMMEFEDKGARIDVHFKTLDSQPVFYLPNAEPSLRR